MEKKGRSYTQVEKQMSYETFKKFCIKIAEEYANLTEEYARSYFMKEYDITASCFYKILETTVIYGWVSDKMVDKMEAKALANQKAHATKAGMSTKMHYKEMKVKRQEYIISTYTEKEIEDLATKFAESSLSKQDFANEEGITVKILELLLKKSIVELIIVDSVFNDIWQRSINNTTPDKKEKVKDFFVNLARERYSKISELLSN